MTSFSYSAGTRKAVGTRRGSILVLVEDGLRLDLRDSLVSYTTDLSREGYATTARSIAVNAGPLGDVFMRAPRDLKTVIRDWWGGLFQEMGNGALSPMALLGNSGVVVVGDLPIARVHERRGHWVKPETGESGCYEGIYTSGIFYTDLNGDWSYVDKTFLPALSTVDPYPAPDSECLANEQDDPKWLYPPSEKSGASGAEPDIFLGRICAKRVSAGSRAVEVQLLKDYFARNHDYRMGKWLNNVTIPLTNLSVVAWPRLAWYDDDWNSWGPTIATSMGQAWPGFTVANNEGSDWASNRYVTDLGLTTRADWVQRLTGTQWLWVDFLAHSNPWDHAIKVGTADEWVSSWQLPAMGLKSLFYLLQGCDTSDYTQDNNLAETYLFRGKSLTVLGNTTVGPCDSGEFYRHLGYGCTIGQAFMMQQWLYGQSNWQPNIASAGAVDPKRYYSWVIVGDPTLPVVPPQTPAYQQVCSVSAPKFQGLLQGHTRGQDAAKFAGALADKVRLRVQTEDPEKFRVVQNLTPGLAFEVSRNVPVVDPQWRTYMNRGVVQPRFQPVLRRFRPLDLPRLQNPPLQRTPR